MTFKISLSIIIQFIFLKTLRITYILHIMFHEITVIIWKLLVISDHDCRISEQFDICRQIFRNRNNTL